MALPNYLLFLQTNEVAFSDIGCKAVPGDPPATSGRLRVAAPGQEQTEGGTLRMSRSRQRSIQWEK